MGKNIVIFSDGTGQIGGTGNNTNVYKLFNMVEDRTEKQVVFYDPGLGTNRQKFTGNIFGNGFSKNMIDCYRFLFENYNAGDEVFLFGFSRGAATVRSMSGFVHLFGVLPRSREDLIEQAFEIYKKSNQQKRESAAKAFIEKNHTMWCKIKFLGVFDTVAALGIHNSFDFVLNYFYPHRFHNYMLSESVQYARHALSIDDERKLFAPVVWDALNEETEDPRMKQVWFCGVHTDVGGGYAEEELSNISLRWMLNEAVPKGLRIYEKSPVYQKLLSAPLNADGQMHNEQTGWKGWIFRRKIRTWNDKTHGPPVIHASVFERVLNSTNSEDPKYAPWIRKYEKFIIEK